MLAVRRDEKATVRENLDLVNLIGEKNIII